MTTTHLKPGDIVQHPEHGYGVVLKNFPGVPTIYFAGKHGYENTTRGFTGWERVETVRPGHVQVRVDDLDLSRWEGVFEGGGWNHATRVAIRAANAMTAQPAESTPPADEQVADEQPANATVTLPCPDCGEPITNTAMVEVNREGERYLDFCNVNVHTCPPAQPDEPTDFGARITVTDGLSVVDEQWCRQHDGYWASENGALMTWAYLTQRGAVTLGWETLGWDE